MTPFLNCEVFLQFLNRGKNYSCDKIRDIGKNAFYIAGNQLMTPQWVYELLVWFGYVNSCANPFIYTMFNQDFRYAFTELLCLRGCTLNSRIRSEMYSKQIGSSSGTNHSIISSRSVADKPPESTIPLEAHELN